MILVISHLASLTLCAPGSSGPPNRVYNTHTLTPKAPHSDAVFVRTFLHGGTAHRDGRLSQLPTDDLTAAAAGDEDDPQIHGGAVLAHLQSGSFDLERYEACAYDAGLGGWRPVTDDLAFPLPASDDVHRIDIQLMPRRPPPQPKPQREPGFFCVGVMGGKNDDNLGTLWRSAFQLGAAQIFTVGERHKLRESSDTIKAWRRLPLVRHEDWNAFQQASPVGAVHVAVEMGGEPLETFEHPPNAVYILGSEDNGLPASVIKSCHRHVELPVAEERSSSFNVAVAGSVLMYDRLAKERRE